MKRSFYPLCTLISAFGMALTGSAFAQTQQANSAEYWQTHTTNNIHSSTQNSPVYNNKPSLKPAKKNLKNPLRTQGWHTAPDPYIEEGGVYTNQTHPALTQHGRKLHHYSDGSQNNRVGPPSTVLNAQNNSRQQAVKIQNPVPGNLPPIPLPPEKNE